MPNISLTFRCNLRCPYCFAREFVDGDSDDISLENFNVALEFLTKGRVIHLGLIGGEPTFHPRFGEILKCAIDHPSVGSVTVFTNGILLGRYTELLVHPKVSLLINWNTPEMLGEKTFQIIQSNVDTLIFDHQMQHRLNLGLNVCDSSMDYDYMTELLKRYRLHKVRVSLTIPEFPEKSETNVLELFRGYKGFLLEFFRDMDAIEVLPYYDCNRPPYCIWTDEEKKWLEFYVAKYGGEDTSLIDTKSFCRPVIDILPDLQAVRCFGTAFYEKVNIADFPSLEELTAHFMRRIDRPSFKIPASEECVNCHLRRTWLCCQGCMGFKANDIQGIID